MLNQFLQHFRDRLADTQSQLHLALLGVVSGFCCAMVMLAFRGLIELPGHWMPHGNGDFFEQLPPLQRFLLPLLGALILGLIMMRLKPGHTRTGLPHVITRLHADNGHLPLTNALLQFFGGALALATGQSGGREGPAIHLGAAINSALGQKLQLPNNSIRTLVGCGTAAAIAASFNTPIAGVIFAMEVVMMEYTVAGFTPVILAAVTATTMTRAVYGSESIFTIPALVELTSLWELPYIAFLGLIAGAATALFISILKISLRFSEYSALPRMACAGLLTATIGLLVPEVLGIGYDSLNAAFAGQLTIATLLAIIAAKIIATAVSSGLGMPIGLIGPSLLIGAGIGAVLGTIGQQTFPELASSTSMYVLLGMGATMGAILNAPLAALMALLELSGNPNIIFPAMLAIVVATLTNSEIFKQRSASQTVFRHLRQLLRTDPFSLALQRGSASHQMDRSVKFCSDLISRDEAQQLLQQPTNWLVIKDQDYYLLGRQDYVTGISNALKHESLAELSIRGSCENCQRTAILHVRATLREALDLMDDIEGNAVYITGKLTANYRDAGVLTREEIYRYAMTPQ